LDQRFIDLNILSANGVSVLEDATIRVESAEELQHGDADVAKEIFTRLVDKLENGE
jgi:hypothetical protein